MYAFNLNNYRNKYYKNTPRNYYGGDIYLTPGILNNILFYYYNLLFKNGFKAIYYYRGIIFL